MGVSVWGSVQINDMNHRGGISDPYLKDQKMMKSKGFWESLIFNIASYKSA